MKEGRGKTCPPRKGGFRIYNLLLLAIIHKDFITAFVANLLAIRAEVLFKASQLQVGCNLVLLNEKFLGVASTHLKSSTLSFKI